MKTYEYIKLDVLDEPTKEEVQEALKQGCWVMYDSTYNYLDRVAEDILEVKHSDWETYDEDETVYLIVREYGKQEFEVVAVSLYFLFRASSETIFTEDDF
ncbi:hypothetical protein [Mannheimia haemolytica]|uniref:hypothetical protein n=1 Tax=Mannheimia haemolytica TaxID=75985 RepID=UPI000588C141|nr:hypothetical protein [Mannheimia haemolytica]AJE07767.1 hypothetical protein B824_9720 [Mannheimia haemolytica USDA-ARS-USMARC-184]UQX63697.1 hypothetical protein M3709_04305 [Mannheimia haemolytica]